MEPAFKVCVAWPSAQETDSQQAALMVHDGLLIAISADCQTLCILSMAEYVEVT
jgi:hypothetical protein